MGKHDCPGSHGRMLRNKAIKQRKSQHTIPDPRLPPPPRMGHSHPMWPTYNGQSYSTAGNSIPAGSAEINIPAVTAGNSIPASAKPATSKVTDSARSAGNSIPASRVGLVDVLTAHYGSPGRLANYRRQFEKTTRMAGEDPSIFAIALETLAVKAFGDIGQTVWLRLIRDRFIAGHNSCELRRHLDSDQ